MKRILLALIFLNSALIAVKPDDNNFAIMQVMAMPNPMQAAVNAHQVILFNAQAAAFERNLVYLGGTAGLIAGLYLLSRAATKDKANLGLAAYFLICSGVCANIAYRSL